MRGLYGVHRSVDHPQVRPVRCPLHHVHQGNLSHPPALRNVNCLHSLQKVNGEPENEKCLDLTRRGGTYENEGIKMRCKRLVTREKGKEIENIEIIPVSPKGAVFLGVTDMNDRASIQRGEKAVIRSAIRHGHAYEGGGTYGYFGGYDITLITLRTELGGKSQRACLPHPGFPDSGHGKGKLAGYGMYERGGEKCQTNEFGMMKFHYCRDVSIK